MYSYVLIEINVAKINWFVVLSTDEWSDWIQSEHLGQDALYLRQGRGGVRHQGLQ